MAGGEIGRADLAPDFVLRMELVALHDLLKMADRFRQATLRARDAAELIVRIQLVPVDFNCSLKAFASFVQFTASLVDQSEVVMR